MNAEALARAAQGAFTLGSILETIGYDRAKIRAIPAAERAKKVPPADARRLLILRDVNGNAEDALRIFTSDSDPASIVMSGAMRVEG